MFLRAIKSGIGLIFATILLFACTQEDLAIIQLDTFSLHVEIAKSPEERQLGLMHRESLLQDHGMLFVFDYDDDYSFWMKNTHIPLSIAFIDRNGCIRDIQDMAPHSLRAIKPPVPVRYALEVNQGLFSSLGISAGMCLAIPEEAQ